MNSTESNPDRPIIFFDGYCNLCNASVQFVLRNEAAEVLSFASLQSDYARRVLTEIPKADSDYATLILLEGGNEYHRSEAALRINRYLRPPWKYIWYAIYVPKYLRDAVYNFVARHRYSVFGKKESCIVPSPDLRERFFE